jgi:hypothetical protein
VYLWPFFYLRLALAATASAMLAADHLFTAPFKESEKINWAFDLPPVAKLFFFAARFQIC